MSKSFFAGTVCFLFSFFSHAQPPQVGSLLENEFSVTIVPDKWKNESAVIIGQKEEYLFSRLSSGKNYTTVVRINEHIHKRIKLQDKNALEKFSAFYYVTMGKDGKAQYQIVKANGKTTDVDMSTAIEEEIEEEKDVPAIYKPIYFKMNVKSMKIAIPNLEVGDIIDYTIQSAFDWDMKTSGIEFTPFIFSLANNYPTMYQQYRFTMANGMKVKYRGYNGAPGIKFDAKSSTYGDKNSYLSYYFLDRDRDKTAEERWSYELRNTPSVKFRVVLLADNDPDSKRSLGEATVDRSGLNIDDVYKRYVGAALYRTPTVNSLVGYTTEYLLKKKTEGSLKNDDDIIRECYYCLRKVFLEMYYKGPVHSDLEKYMTGKKLYKKVLAQEKKEATQKEEREDEIRINSITFSTAFRTALATVGIASELEVYVPRNLGSWRDAIFMEELDFVMKVKSKRRQYYLDAFNNFDAFGTLYPYMEGAEGYSIGYQEENQYYRSNIPGSGFTENMDKQEYIIHLSETMDAVKVERVSSFLGAEKISRIAKANLDRDYLGYDFTKYYVEPNQKSKKKKEEEVDITTSAKYDNPDKDEKIKQRKELFEKDAKEEFDLDKYNDFELLQNGRYGDTAFLQYKEKFSLKKMISKAGKNYVLDIGKLIGDQIKLEQTELASRQTDIWIPFARTIENTIVLNVPAGYTVDGLQDLNTSVDNESGSFLSTAKLEENKLVVTTKKRYKKNFDKKELWSNYVAFLEPAYKFSQVKIVLKKK